MPTPRTHHTHRVVALHERIQKHIYNSANFHRSTAVDDSSEHWNIRWNTACQLPASTKQAAFSQAFFATSTGAIRTSLTSVQKPVDLINDEFQRQFAVLVSLGGRNTLCGHENAVWVDASLAVHSVPYDTWQIEQYCLHTPHTLRVCIKWCVKPLRHYQSSVFHRLDP